MNTISPPDDAPIVASRAATFGADAIRLSLTTCLGFGVGTVGVSVMLNAVTIYFPAFMTTVLGQSPGLAGLLLMVSKLYDAVCDVVVGLMSDRTRSRWGRRRPYLLAGAAASSASFLMLFTPSVMSEPMLIAYMAAALVLYSTGYSLFNVPYMAMPSEMTDGFHERTRLLSYRTLFVSIGQLLASAGTAELIKHGGGGAFGYKIMGIVMALVILTSMISAFFGTARARSIGASHDKPRLTLAQLGLLARNRPFVMLMGAKVFQFLSFSSLATTGLLFMLNVVHIGYGGQAQLAVAQNVAGALGLPVWVRLGRTIGKRNTYLIGVFLFCAVALSWMFVGSTISTTGLWVRGVISGFGSSALILMSISMLSDTMSYDRRLTGLHREGLMSSVVAIIEKTAFALGVAVVGWMLKVMNYLPTFGGKLVPQPVSAVHALYAGFALIPIAMFACNALFMAFYHLDEGKLSDADQTPIPISNLD